MKRCLKCGEIKDLLSFHKSKKYPDGHLARCKKCCNEQQQQHRREINNINTFTYEKTINGFVMRMYRNMMSRISGIQKAKYHLYENKELFSRSEFYDWIKNDKIFLLLFKEWKESGYSRKLTPSVDRIDSTKGYSIDNVECVTHSENSRRGALSSVRIRSNIYNNQYKLNL